MLLESVEEYSADATRFALADAGDRYVRTHVYHFRSTHCKTMHMITLFYSFNLNKIKFDFNIFAFITIDLIYYFQFFYSLRSFSPSPFPLPSPLHSSTPSFFYSFTLSQHGGC